MTIETSVSRVVSLQKALVTQCLARLLYQNISRVSLDMQWTNPVTWANSHVQRQLVGYSIDSNNECIIVFRSESKLDTRSGML